VRPTQDAALESLVERIDGVPPGGASPDTVPSGFPSLDRMLGGGFRRQDLVVLGGEIGSGKSALALAMAIRSARAGVPTLVLSGEMSAERVLERALAIEGGAAIDDLRQGRLDAAARAAVGAAAVRLRDVPLQLRPLVGERFDEITASLEQVPGRSLVVVDSLQLAPAPRAAGRLDERIALAVRALKGLAVERNLAVLALAQLPRLRSDRPDPRPTVDDLGALGAIKQSADVILAIYREEMYRSAQGVEGATELIVAKNRNGPTGFVDLYFRPRILRFEDMLDPS
jgi:replicative DNA helicase